ncbi:hypothetical protein EI94DRAFT_1796088 [Lactarius quietus]|nr:hypothetical protein EI94DRAFT_1796088 [Lactarius quietus]
MDAKEEYGLQDIRNFSRDVLYWVYNTLVPVELRPPVSFWLRYDEEQQTIGLRASLLLWVHSEFQELPQEFQLNATIAMMSGQDSLIDVGTGAGKTLCMILPCLLAPNTMAVVFSPLNRLQAVQVLAFSRNITGTSGYSVLLVQPEQLYMSNAGHLPRLARLMAGDRHFVKLIQRVHVDEAHFIYTAGLKHYGLPALRSAWGGPPHIKVAIIENLLFDESRLCAIKLTSNRPNIVYATHPIVGELSDFRNLDFVVPRPYPAGWHLPKTVVFHDNVMQAAEAALYHTQRLPEGLQKEGLVMHYHGIMSKEYVTRVYEDFSDPNGHCRVLHASGGASMVLDIPDITIVVQYGITREVLTALQRGGRGGRSPTDEAIFLLMYEPWVKSIDLAAVEVDTVSDPDHPTVPQLTDNLTKQERSGVAMIKTIQLEHECLRKLYATYLKDTAHDGTDVVIDTFDPISTGTISSGVVSSTKILKLRNYIMALLTILIGKRSSRRRRRSGRHSSVLAKDPLASVLPAYFILDDMGIKTLARLHPSNITHPGQVVDVLNETQEWQDEWAVPLFQVIQDYDHELADHRKEEDGHRSFRHELQGS